MLNLNKSALVALLLSALPAHADTLSRMAGSWSGDGWARQVVDGPQEPVRCRLTNTFDEQKQRLEISGRCAVPGRQLTMAGRLDGQRGSDRISGIWFNPDGLGSTNVSGTQGAGRITFAFSAKDPQTGEPIAQTVEWRLSGGSLDLVTVDRADPEKQMSQMTFTK